MSSWGSYRTYGSVNKPFWTIMAPWSTSLAWTAAAFCRRGSVMLMWALIGPQKCAVTSWIPTPRRSPSPAAPALVSSPSAPVCISARWSASDEPSVGSYLVQREADRETERSRPRRTDKERDIEAEVWRDKVSFQLGEDSNLGLKLHLL